MSHEECQICANPKIGRNCCSNCNFHMCRPCTKRCVEMSRSEEPQCPNCQIVWSKDEQYKLLTKRFVNTVVRKRQRDGVITREMARMEHTVPFARREFHQREFRRLNAVFQSMLTEVQSGSPTPLDVATLQQIQTQLQQVTQSIRDAKRSTLTSRSLPCAHDNCHGRTDPTTGHCWTCRRVTCRHCTMAVEDISTHVCDPEVVLSVNNIASECRPCANCSAMTARVEGCPVMWCANCHTFWHWETREIMPSRGGRNAPHNPDHRAWLAAAQAGLPAPRELGDVPCGGVPTYEDMHGALSQLIWRLPQINDNTLNIARWLIEIRNLVEHTHLRVRPQYPLVQDENMLSHDLRVALLLGDIVRPTFERRAEQRVRKVQYQQAIGPIVEMFTFCGIDILIRVVRACHDEYQLASCYFELDTLRNIVNHELEVVQREHGRKTPFLDRDWRWVLPYSRKILRRE